MKQNDKENIGAVVVTFNRKEILKECLQSLLSQTLLPNKIYVMDNDSIDGTEILMSTEFNMPIIEYINIKGENIGPAACQEIGANKAVKEGMDWVWICADDDIADKNCLDTLIKNAHKFNMLSLSPLIYYKEDCQLFPISKDYGERFEIEDGALDKYGDIIYGVFHFGGFIIHKTVFETIEVFDKRLFIWGPEYDLLFKLQSRYTIGICTKAIYYMPMPRCYEKQIKFWNGIFGIARITPPFKFYIHIRNFFYLVLKYGNHFYFFGSKSRLRTFLKHSSKTLIKYLAYSIYSRDFTYFKLCSLAIYHALIEKFGYEQKLL